jgi:hypothetical protein
VSNEPLAIFLAELEIVVDNILDGEAAASAECPAIHRETR